MSNNVVKKQENSSVEIVKGPHGYTASWVKYDRQITGEGVTDVKAIRNLVGEIDNILEQDRLKDEEALLKDEVAQDHAIQNASQIDDIMKSRWFRSDELAKALNSKLSNRAVVDMLSMLGLFGLVQIKKNTNPNYPEVKYKITLRNTDRVAIMDETINFYKSEIIALEKEKSDMMSQPVIKVVEGE